LDESAVQLRETVPENQRIGEDGNAGDRAILEEELLTSLNLLAIEPRWTPTDIFHEVCETRISAEVVAQTQLLQECVSIFVVL
jgi:hypothetical protein